MSWTASPDANVTGYRVYYGTASRSYLQRRGEGIQLGRDESYLVPRRTPGTLHYFAVTAFDIARSCAMGADWCNSARGFMFALGCIQAQSCHTGLCPTGVTTQDPGRYRALVVPDKAERVLQFHQNTLKALKELLSAAGLSHTDQIGPEHIIRRVNSTEVRSLATLYPWVKPGALVDGVAEQPAFKYFWDQATPDTFVAPPNVLALQTSKMR